MNPKAQAGVMQIDKAGEGDVGRHHSMCKDLETREGIASSKLGSHAQDAPLPFLCA